MVVLSALRAARSAEASPSPLRERPSGGWALFASSSSLLHSLLQGSVGAEEFSSQLASHAADRAWLLAFSTVLREQAARTSEPRQMAQPVTASTPRAHEHVLAACRAERDLALAEVDTLRARVAELKSSLEYVSNFERFGGIGPVESVANTPREIRAQADRLDAEYRKVTHLREALTTERNALETSRRARIRKKEEILASARESTAAMGERLEASHKHKLQLLREQLAEERRLRAADAQARTLAQNVSISLHNRQLADAHHERDAARAAAKAAKEEAAARMEQARRIEERAEERARVASDELVKLQLALHASGALAIMQRLQEGYCLEQEERAQLLEASAATTQCIKCGGRQLRRHTAKDNV